jgi:hypothetical protein
MARLTPFLRWVIRLAFPHWGCHWEYLRLGWRYQYLLKVKPTLFPLTDSLIPFPHSVSLMESPLTDFRKVWLLRESRLVYLHWANQKEYPRKVKPNQSLH